MRNFLSPPGLAAVLLCLSLSPIVSPVASAQDAAAPASAPVRVPVPAQEPPSALTLEAALALATAQNPTLSAARIELDSTEGGITQARVIPNPEVAVQMEDTRAATRATTGQVNLPIELGGKRSARIGAANRARDVAQAQLGTT